MTIAAGVVLALAAFIFVGYPLFRQRPYSTASRGEGRRRGARARQEMTDSTLDELEFDHEAGVLSDEDYREMEQRYRRQVAPSAGVAERSASAGRARPAGIAGPAAIEDEIEQRVRQMRKGKGRFCTKCGAGINPSDRFCTNCGASVKEQGGRS